MPARPEPVLEDEIRRLPPALTVEQAAGLLRIGRSKAYDAVRTGDPVWYGSDGVSGSPTSPTQHYAETTNGPRCATRGRRDRRTNRRTNLPRLAEPQRPLPTPPPHDARDRHLP